MSTTPHAMPARPAMPPRAHTPTLLPETSTLDKHGTKFATTPVNDNLSVHGVYPKRRTAVTGAALCAGSDTDIALDITSELYIGDSRVGEVSLKTRTRRQIVRIDEAIFDGEDEPVPAAQASASASDATATAAAASKPAAATAAKPPKSPDAYYSDPWRNCDEFAFHNRPMGSISAGNGRIVPFSEYLDEMKRAYRNVVLSDYRVRGDGAAEFTLRCY